MLPKRYRLRQQSDVQRVRRHGRPFRHPLAILLVTRSPISVDEVPNIKKMSSHFSSRFTFMASRRVGSAVVRNRAKRMLREAVRSHIHQIQPGWDGIFIARQSTAPASMPEIEKAVVSLLLRANILLSN